MRENDGKWIAYVLICDEYEDAESLQPQKSW